MEDLSLHILDVAENSIDAGAKTVEIKIDEDLKKNLLVIEIIDNGKGMDAETMGKSLDPFFTTKTVREVGLGLSMFREAAIAANGDLSLRSKVGRGTKVRATFQHGHIDRKPLGDLTRTMTTLIISHPEVHFRYLHRKNRREHRLDTKKLEARGGRSSLTLPELLNLIRQSLSEIESF